MFPIDISKLFDQLTYHVNEPLIFNSGLFLFLFTGFLIIYFLLAKSLRAKLIFVTIFSLYFYYKSSGFYFLILITSTIVDYNLAKLVYQSSHKRKRFLLMLTSLVINLGLLGYFKYTNFFAEIFSNITGNEFQPFDIFLPVGVSFFTFQSLSYTIDVYRNNLKPVDSILDYAFYLSFFPQLVAGPIVRASEFLPQIHQPTFVSKEMFGRGMYLICTGLFKKAVISNYISLNFVDRIFDAPTLYTGLENLFGVYGYALQIYCDFSGYSDMAIGLALILGFQFSLNFNSPYQSKNITEFWRRWHMSLSTWLRDYLYISLGGNRKGKFRTYVNLILTMLLGGLWHGASFRFILWGGFHGLALAIHKAFSSWFPEKENKSIWLKIAGVFVTFHFVCFCWIFFRASDMTIAIQVISQIFSHFSPQVFTEFVMGYKGVLFLMVIGYILHFLPKSIEEKAEQTVTIMPLPIKALMFVVVVILVIQTKSAGIQPFIYFQF